MINKKIRIISGGQTGADQGGYDAAIKMQLEYGGWIPKNRKSENGKIPEKYKNLKEVDSSNYLVRTEKNILASYGTIIFLGDIRPTGGSKRTIDFCLKHNKPYLIVKLCDIYPSGKGFVGQERQKELEHLILDFIKKLYIIYPTDHPVINIAGSRESKCPGIQKKVEEVIINVVRKIEKN